MLRTNMMNYFIAIQLRVLVKSDIFDLITPRSVPDDVRPYLRDPDFELELARKISFKSAIKPWLFYIEANIINAIQTCLSKRNKKEHFSKMWKCMMNCSPSCRMMNFQLKKQSISVKFGWANSFAVNYPPTKKTNIIGRHILTPDACSVTYPDPIVVVYQKLLMSVWYNFDVELSLRINFTFLHFDLTEKLDCFHESALDWCHRESLVFVHIMNRPSRDGIHFKVSCQKIYLAACLPFSHRNAVMFC